MACISTLAPKSVERRSDKVRLIAYKGLANNRRADARPLYTRDRYRFIPYATAQCKRVDGYTCSSLGRSEMDTRHGLQEATASNQGRSGNPRQLATLVPAYGMVAHEWQPLPILTGMQKHNTVMLVSTLACSSTPAEQTKPRQGLARTESLHAARLSLTLLWLLHKHQAACSIPNLESRCGCDSDRLFSCSGAAPSPTSKLGGKAKTDIAFRELKVERVSHESNTTPGTTSNGRRLQDYGARRALRKRS